MKNSLLKVAAEAARIVPKPLKRSLYRIKPLAALIRSLLNRAAPEGLVPTTIASGDLAGMSLNLNLKTEKDYWLGTYEVDLQVAIREFVSPGMVVYDVGANIGYISPLLAKTVGSDGRVICFEAHPTNLARLKNNIELNNLDNRITIIQGAVAGDTQPVSFLIHESTSMGKVAGSSGRQEEHYHEKITVPGITLDYFVFEQGNPAPNAIKMDIEGGEVMAIQGMQRILNEIHPLLLIELHGEEAAKGVGEILSAAGYQLHRMASGYATVPTIDSLDWKAYVIAK